MAHLDVLQNFTCDADASFSDCFIDACHGIQHVDCLKTMCNIIVYTLLPLTSTGINANAEVNAGVTEPNARLALKVSGDEVQQLLVTASFIRLFGVDASVTAMCAPQHVEQLKELTQTARLSGGTDKVSLSTLSAFVHDEVRLFELSALLNFQFRNQSKIDDWVWDAVEFIIARVVDVDTRSSQEERTRVHAFGEAGGGNQNINTDMDGPVARRNPAKTGVFYYHHKTGHQWRPYRHFVKDDRHTKDSRHDDAPSGTPCLKPTNRVSAAKTGTYYNHFSSYCVVSQMYRGGHFMRGAEGTC